MKMVVYLLAVIILITACDKNSDSGPVSPLTDIDGNGYDTLKIGLLFWMKQNLTTSHYRNGDPIPEITSTSLWSTITSGAWCWYNNDSVTYAAVYGKLYNWYAVNDPRGLAPEGWHVPGDQEWLELSLSLGGDLVSGGKLKESGTSHWTTPNTGATNSSGMSLLPGGYRGDGGAFENIGINGIWWSSTGNVASDAYCRFLSYMNTNFFIDDAALRSGYSVRCIRD